MTVQATPPGDDATSRRVVASVVVSYNTSRLAPLAVRSVLDAGADSVVVVDNASPRPGEWESLTSQLGEVDHVLLHRAERNDGFGAGVNLGLSLLPAGTTHVLLMNPDATLAPTALTSMLAALADAADRAVVAPRIEKSDGSVWSDGGCLDLAAGSTRRREGPPSADVTRETFLTGAVLLMPLAVLDEVGPIREDLFMYWEDADFSRRASAAGVPLILDHRAGAVHDAGASSTGRAGSAKSALWHYYVNRNRLVVCREQGASRVGLLLGPGRRATRSLLATAYRSDDRQACLVAAARGILAGWRYDLGGRGARGPRPPSTRARA